MAEIDIGAQMTLAELRNRTVDKNVLEIAMTLDKQCPILKDAIWVEANQLASHKTTKTLSLPSGTWRKINEGAPFSAGTTVSIIEQIGILENYSRIDEEIVELSPDPKKTRSDEDMLIVEGLAQQFESAFFYGNVGTDPASIHGVANRYNTLGGNVWNAGGSGSDLTSIWIIQWDKGGVHLIYPRGSKTLGIEIEDLGKHVVYDANSNPFTAYLTHFKIKVGIVIRDDRCIQRIANVETTGTANIFDPDLLVAALNNMKNDGKGAVIYCNKTIKTQMDIQAMNKTNVNYTIQNAFGESTTYFRGVPVRIAEMIVDTETAVT